MTTADTRFVPEPPKNNPITATLPAVLQPNTGPERSFILENLIDELEINPFKESIRVRDLFEETNHKWADFVPESNWYKDTVKQLDELKRVIDTTKVYSTLV